NYPTKKPPPARPVNPAAPLRSPPADPIPPASPTTVRTRHCRPAARSPSETERGRSPNRFQPAAPGLARVRLLTIPEQRGCPARRVPTTTHRSAHRLCRAVHLPGVIHFLPLRLGPRYLGGVRAR